MTKKINLKHCKTHVLAFICTFSWFWFCCIFPWFCGGAVPQLQRVEQEAEAARKTLGLQTEEDKKRAQFADELERKRQIDQVGDQ